MRNMLIALMIIILTGMFQAGQGQDHIFSESARREILIKLGDLLERNYVYADIGDSCKNYITQNEVFNRLVSIERDHF